MSKLAKITVTKEKKMLTELQDSADRYVVIENEADVFAATEVILRVRQLADEIEDKRKEYSKPMKELVDKLNNEFKEVTSPLTLMETKLKEAIVAYVMKHNAEADVKLTELRNQVGDQELVLDLKLTNLKTQSGEIRFRTDIQFEVVDQSAVPKKFLKTVVDTDAIKKAIDDNNDVVIPGIEIRKVPKPALYVDKR